jgi:hypothetical protein
MMKLPRFVWIVLFTVLTTFAKSQTPTWAENIAPILYNNCTSCHHTGGLAPNALVTYSQAFNYRYMIKSYSESNYMPPWPPDAQYKHLAFQRILPASDKALIAQWVLGGAPEGNPANAPVPPVYTDAPSQLPSIDFTAKMPNYMVNTGTDLYRCFVINTNLSVTKFASEIEVIPGNSSIVHHVLVYEDTTNVIPIKDSADAGAGYTSFFGTGSSNSKLIGEWVPGTRHIKFPDGMGVKIRKNSRLILQIHYPKGTYQKLDSTRVNIKFANTSLTPLFREVYIVPAISETNLVNGPLVIPPNVVKTFTASMVANQATPLGAYTMLSIAPHMHLIGKSMKVFALNATTQDTMPLISIPKWDFKWQGIYNFRNPLKVPQGSTLIAHSAYDNTTNNPSNPNNPPITVVQGESTDDEMMLVFFAFTYYLPGDENIVIDNSPLDVGISEQEGIVNSLQLYNVYPNPAKGSAQMNYFSPAGGTGQAKITSVDGKIVKEWPQSLQPGYGNMPLNLEGLAKGQYFITLQTKNFTRTKPFIVHE